jgi:hypothetical protein
MADGLDTARFTKPLELKKRPTRRVWALVQLHPPNPPPRPASGSPRLPNTLGQVGEQYGPSIAPFERDRCPFSPLLRPYSPGGAARGSHTGQFSCFGPRSCFLAPVLDIPNGVWPLDRAVGRAYIRETVPTHTLGLGSSSSFFWLVASPRAHRHRRLHAPCRIYIGRHKESIRHGAAQPAYPIRRPCPHPLPWCFLQCCSSNQVTAWCSLLDIRHRTRPPGIRHATMKPSGFPVSVVAGGSGSDAPT